MADKKNILLITIDSLRADFLKLYGGHISCPNLESLTEESILYKNAFSTGGHTKHSFPGILASNYPTSGGVNRFGERTSIAYYLKKGGYKTAAFHSNPLLSASRGYSRGFDTFWDSVSKSDILKKQSEKDTDTILHRLSAFLWKVSPKLYKVAQKVYQKFLRVSKEYKLPYELGEQTTKRTCDWIQGTKEPFFVWLHYMDVHQPWAVHENISGPEDREIANKLTIKANRSPEKLSSDELETLKGFYSKEVEYTDKCLGQVFDFLKEKGLWDNTTIAVTSDHGEGFMEHGVMLHGNSLYEELLHVPLVIKESSWQRQEIGEPTSLIDIPPTLLSLAGEEMPVTFEGMPLGPVPQKEYVISENSHRVIETDQPDLAMIRDQKFKLILNLVSGGVELYNIEDDPGEKENLAEKEKDVLQKMRSLLEEHIARKRPNVAPPDDDSSSAGQAETSDDEQVKERLRALGYFDE
jgi:arylsulfatase A-like enzyme